MTSLLMRQFTTVVAVSFFHNESIKNETPGRPSVMQDIFEHMCLWLEDESELYTLEELQMKMLEYSGNNDVYSTKRIKQKLIERYNNYVFLRKWKKKRCMF